MHEDTESGGEGMSECLMTIMSAQYSHRTGVEVSFVRDENKKEACFFSAFLKLTH